MDSRAHDLLALQDEDAGRSSELAFCQALMKLAELDSSARVLLALEGLPPRELEVSVGRAVQRGLLRELEQSPEPSVHMTLYRIGRALPAGEVHEHIGRHLDQVLRSGPGAIRVHLLACMASAERRRMRDPGLVHHISLCLAHAMLDEGTQVLALSLLASRELQQQWLAEPAAGALPRRMMAARLLAAAARGAVNGVRRADRAGLALLSSAELFALRQRLLFDREPLVWQPAALARGWLAECSPHEAARFEADLAPNLSPTEWRRAGVSLVASATANPKAVFARLSDMQRDGLFESDRGLAAAMLVGLTGAPDQPETTTLAGRLIELSGGHCVNELTLLLDSGAGDAVRQAAEPLLRSLPSQHERESVAGEAFAERRRVAEQDALGHAFEGLELADSVHAHVQQALRSYWRSGPAEACEHATEALRRADQVVESLRGADPRQAHSAWNIFQAVRELQQGVLRDGSLTDLLALCDEERLRTGLGYFRERLTHLLLAWQAQSDATSIEVNRERAVAAIRVLDMEISPTGGHSRADQGARTRALEVLLDKLREPHNAPLRRPLCAAVARAADSLVREGSWELADAFFVASSQLPDTDSCRIMAEACMLPEVAQSLHSLANCLQTRGESLECHRQQLDHLLQSLPVLAGPRSEALRMVLSELANGFWSRSNAERMSHVCAALGKLEALTSGHRLRLGIPVGQGLSEWSQVFADIDDRDTLRARLKAGLGGALSEWVQEAVAALLAHGDVPIESSADGERVGALPDWLPATREIGNYVVMRCVGGGAGGSVLLAKRREQQLRAGAPMYALKVPDVGATGTTTLSRERFMEMFCAEAGALASLPRHPNLASLESFDRAAFPLPFLVMEHVDGPTLESEIAAQRMDIERAIDSLLGVARGLQVMHAHGMGHLDLKPANVILAQRGDGPEAVLVDFGLAGRCVRPGCGTHAYAAPEVFGADADQADPCAADVYSLAVLAFEVLTGKPLFTGPTEFAYIAQHVSHGGNPEGLAQLDADPQLSQLSSLLRSMLAPEPADRCDIATVLDVLAALRRPCATPPPLPGGKKTETSLEHAP